MKIDLMEKKANNPSEAFMKMFNIPNGENSDSIKISLSKLCQFPEHETFHSYDKGKLDELAENIREYGVLSPVIVRPLTGGKYQILAGHNRTSAAKLAGLTEIPCIIKECDDETAQVIFVATNLHQREKLLPSEKAYAYKMLLKARRVDEVAISTSENRRQVYRYLRLTYLIKPLLDMVDSGTLDFVVGVNLSYLIEEKQELLFDYITEHKIKVKKQQSEEIKDFVKENDLTISDLDSFLMTQCHRNKSIKIPMTKISNYFSDTMSQNEIVEQVVEIVREHFDK